VTSRSHLRQRIQISAPGQALVRLRLQPDVVDPAEPGVAGGCRPSPQRSQANRSTRDQNPDARRDALDAVGCNEVFVDKPSGRLVSRPKLDEALRLTRTGDQLVVTKLDRLGRSHTS
jgi:hypothetical protein